MREISQAEWRRTRSFGLRAFDEITLRDRTESVSVCLPAHNEAATIGPILELLMRLAAADVIDQVCVIDHDSDDGTTAIATRLGAEVFSAAELLPEAGPVLGKGDVLWRAMSVASGDVVCFLDADSADVTSQFVVGLIGPLVVEPDIGFVKATYRRPFRLDSVQLPSGGGRVNDLTARPLLDLFYPELAVFRQPLAGEIAARRDLLESLPITTGYAVEIAMLIDAYSSIGLFGMAQADIGSRQNRHRPLEELSPMATAILNAVAVRLVREGRLRELSGVDALPSIVERSALAGRIA